MVGTIVLGFAYDYKVKSENDDYVNLTEKTNYFFARVTKPGEFLVDSLPWRKLCWIYCSRYVFSDYL